MRLGRRTLLQLLAATGAAPLFGAAPVRAADFRLRGIFETPMEEPFVTQLHKAMQRAKDELGVQYEWSEQVKAADYSRVLRQWCEEGVELIVGDAYGTEKICRRVAADYPKTYFCMGSAVGPTEPNFSTFYGLNYEPMYLAGMLGARLTKTGSIGVVAGIAMPSTYMLLNVYRAGAKAIDPNVKFKAAYIGSFFDPPKAKEATIALADQGVDVIFAERVGVIEAAGERNMIAIGNMTDQSAINPAVVVTSVMWDPFPLIKECIGEVKAGAFKAQDLSPFELMNKGGSYLSSYHAFEDRVPADVKDMINTTAAKIVTGELKIELDESETKSD